jgi:hypothetical protein
MRILGSAEKSAHDERLAAQDQQRAFCCGLEKINRQANEMPLGSGTATIQ